MKTSIPLIPTHHHPDAGASPTAMLRAEHEVILRALALLERLGRALEAGKAVDPKLRAWLVDFFRTFADRCHHGKEEQHLFPLLERHGLPRAGGPVGVMLMEHEEGRALVRAIAETDGPKAADAVRRYVALLRAHIDKENGVLFPLADQILPPGEQRGLAEAFEAVEREVAGPAVHERIMTELARLELERP